MIIPLTLMTATTVFLKPDVTRLIKSEAGYSLTVQGKPFFVKGAGGGAGLDLLVQAGGNSIRTWGAENLQRDLDEAQKRGIKVTAGIWLQHADVFDYSDQAKVREQFEMARKVVEQFKDHPALLMWAFGNEMEGYAEANDPNVWRAVNDIAKMAKTIDPNHPTMTVIAEIGAARIPSINKYCPDIDIIGINSYGGAASVAKRYAEIGGTKPYILTEFGPLGPWERPKTPWNAPVEPTSTEKVDMYRTAYQNAVLGNPQKCLGAYVFLWGNKQEGTSTWFGMFLKDGNKTPAVDVMTEFWTGKKPANLSPTITPISLAPAPENYIYKTGQTITASIKTTDPNNDNLKTTWVLTSETEVYLTAGRDEKVPLDYPDALVSSTTNQATFKLPAKPGNFRVFAYVYDGKGAAATANIPLQTK